MSVSPTVSNKILDLEGLALLGPLVLCLVGYKLVKFMSYVMHIMPPVHQYLAMAYIDIVFWETQFSWSI